MLTPWALGRGAMDPSLPLRQLWTGDGLHACHRMTKRPRHLVVARGGLPGHSTQVPLPRAPVSDQHPQHRRAHGRARLGSPLSTQEWAGTWVADRLGLALSTGPSATGLQLAELVGLAVRRNPRRAHLLVSTVLGKHLPTDPTLVHGAGRLLGVLVAQALTGAHPSDRVGGALLSSALAGSRRASRSLLARCLHHCIPPLPNGTLVLGYAETATGLGHCVAAQLGAPVLHSTRRRVPGVPGAPGFEEEHSHATSHLLLPGDPDLLRGPGPLVLVDDELSTGATAANTIIALHAAYPRARYIIAALVDLRSEGDRTALADLEARLQIRIDVVALTTGSVHLPEGVLAAGAQLADGIQPLTATTTDGGQCALLLHRSGWPTTVPEGGRHGITAQQGRQLAAAAAAVARDLAIALPDNDRVHILGFEELMYAPLLIADTLAERLAATVTYSTTTRSPVLVVPEVGYAITSGITFGAHDHPDDGPGARYAYNIPPGATVVVVLDEHANTAQLYAPDGLLAQLTGIAPHVALVTLPSHQPCTDRDDL